MDRQKFDLRYAIDLSYNLSSLPKDGEGGGEVIDHLSPPEMYKRFVEKSDGILMYYILKTKNSCNSTTLL